MAHTCNIDSRGRLIRGLLGSAGLLVALIILALWAVPTGSVIAYVLAAVAAVGGAFSVYEASMSWCAVRALGFKTPF